MKLYYISSSFLPSQEANSVHVMKMVQALAHQGHKITLFAAKGTKYKNKNDVFNHYGVQPSFELEFISRPKIPVFWNFIYTFGISIRVKRLGKPDVFYGRHAFALYVLSLFFSGVPVAFEAHTLPQKKIHKFIEKKLLKKNSHPKLFVISQILKDDYLSLFPFLKNEDVIVVHDGADVPSAQSVEPPKVATTSRKKIKALYCGKLTEGKGMGLLTKLIPLCPDVEFHIVGGSSNDKNFWKGKIESDNVKFHGHVSHGMLGNFYQEADVMLAPLQQNNSLGMNYDIGRWTSPLKIFEYMAYAKPIICSDLPVLREILNNEETALLVAPDDPYEWKTSLDRITANEDFAKRIGQAAHTRLLRHFTWSLRAKRIVDEMIGMSEHYVIDKPKQF